MCVHGCHNWVDHFTERKKSVLLITPIAPKKSHYFTRLRMVFTSKSRLSGKPKKHLGFFLDSFPTHQINLLCKKQDDATLLAHKFSNYGSNKDFEGCPQQKPNRQMRLGIMTIQPPECTTFIFINHIQTSMK